MSRKKIQIFSRVREEKTEDIHGWFCNSLIRKLFFHCSGSTMTKMTWTHMLSLDPRAASMLRLDHRTASMLRLDHRSTPMPRIDLRPTPMTRIDLRPTRMLQAKATPTLTTCTTMEDGWINEEPQRFHPTVTFTQIKNLLRFYWKHLKISISCINRIT